MARTNQRTLTMSYEIATRDLIRSCDQCKIRLNNIRLYKELCSQQAETIVSEEVKEKFELMVAVTTQFLKEAEELINYYSTLLEERAEVDEVLTQLMEPNMLLVEDKFKKMTKKVMLEVGDRIMELENEMMDLYELLMIIHHDEEFWSSDSEYSE